MSRIVTWGATALLLTSAALAPRAASAKPEFGPNINTFCTANNRVPAEPYGSQYPEQCQLCHKAGTFDKKVSNHVQPNWDEFVAAYPGFGGNGDYSFFCPTTAGNQAPVLDPIGNQAVDPDVQLAFVITATDPDGNALSFSATGLPAGAELVDQGDGSAGFAWTPTLDQTGSYPVTFMVADDGSPVANDSETITISVGAVNQPPVLAAVGSHTVYEGSPFSIQLAATDPDGDALAFDVLGLPPSATLADAGDGTGEFGWTPAVGDAGSYPLTVQVTDAGAPALTDSEDVAVEVLTRPVGSLYVRKAKFSAKKGRLKVKGAGATPNTSVEILAVSGDALSPLGSALSNKKGKLGSTLTPAGAPCTVALRIGDLVSLPVAVTGAPDSCLAQ